MGKNPSEKVSRILLLGSKGRLGAALARLWSKTHSVRACARPEVDVTDFPALEKFLKDASYDVLVNCTGMTNVDLCETAREEAEAANVRAPRLMGEAAAKKGARFIHFSTDYVFDGKQSSPYREEDEALPLSHYGQTKLDGEKTALSASPRHMAVRCSWVFGPDKPSFVDMIIDRALQNDQVEAIADKTSCPTYTYDMAAWMEPFLSSDLPGGLYHASNSGGCTWRDYGQEALDCAVRLGLPLRAKTVGSIYLTDMKNFVGVRPPHTVLNTDKLARTANITLRPWQDALNDYLTTKFS